MSKGELIVSDIDNDSELEVLITDLSGRVHIYNNNGLAMLIFLLLARIVFDLL